MISKGGLTGYWFLAVGDSGPYTMGGVVIQHIGDKYILVQYYSAWLSEALFCGVVNLEDTQLWQFHASQANARDFLKRDHNQRSRSPAKPTKEVSS